MVNPEGKGMRCATTGYGNVIAMSTVQSTHVPLRRENEKDRVREDPGGSRRNFAGLETNPSLIKSDEGPAQEIGARAGDQILQRAFTRRWCGAWSVRKAGHCAFLLDC
jgi:hypothetical protein